MRSFQPATNNLDRIPEHFTAIVGAALMTNFDHSIASNAEERLRSGPLSGQYAAWNFCGYVWFGEGKFRCEIWRYRSYVETIVGDTLQEIMDEASERYGED